MVSLQALQSLVATGAFKLVLKGNLAPWITTWSRKDAWDMVPVLVICAPSLMCDCHQPILNDPDHDDVLAEEIESPYGGSTTWTSSNCNASEGNCLTAKHDTKATCFFLAVRSTPAITSDASNAVDVLN